MDCASKYRLVYRLVVCGHTHLTKPRERIHERQERVHAPQILMPTLLHERRETFLEEGIDVSSCQQCLQRRLQQRLACGHVQVVLHPLLLLSQARLHVL